MKMRDRRQSGEIGEPFCGCPRARLVQQGDDPLVKHDRFTKLETFLHCACESLVTSSVPQEGLLGRVLHNRPHRGPPAVFGRRLLFKLRPHAQCGRDREMDGRRLLALSELDRATDGIDSAQNGVEAEPVRHG
eukprot:scaffold180764_cov31-Tisochrysis_lutea.AAC.2